MTEPLSTIPASLPDTANRILVIDDETAMLFACRTLLGNEGFAVDLCTTLPQALDELKKNRYLAIIADVRLQGAGNADGMLLLSVATTLQPDAKVIIMTGYGSEALRQASATMGATHYFEKPVEPSAILSILQQFRQIALVNHIS